MDRVLRIAQALVVLFVLQTALGAPPPNGTVALRSLNTAANGHYGIDYHPLAKKLVVSAYTPTGDPHNFESIDANGAHKRYTNLNKIGDSLVIAVVRESSVANDGKSIGGFGRGEMFFAAAEAGANGSRAGVIGKVSADGSLVHNPWVTLPRPPGPASDYAIRGLHVDSTGIFGGDLIAVTSVGDVWRIDSAGVAKRVAQLGSPLRGTLVVPDDVDRYGPWAGKIVTAIFDGPASIVTIASDGATRRFAFSPDTTRTPVDFEIIPPHQNFFGIDGTGATQKIVGASAQDFAPMVGDVVIAVNLSGSSVLRRMTWNGTAFVVTDLATAIQWKQIAFAPVGIGEVPPVDQLFDKVALVQHAPTINSGRIEGSLWQLLGEPLALNGTDTITLDLFVPGTPAVSAREAPFFGGVVPGSGSTDPSGYPITISGRATLRRLITRTDPVALPTVAPPPTSTGTKDVPDHIAVGAITKWSQIRNVRLNGNDGAIVVPPGTYGRFFATGRAAFVFGEAGATTPAVYNLEELELSGSSELRVVGPVVLTVRDGVTLGGATTAGASDQVRNLALRISSGGLKMSGNSVAYALVRAPQGHVIVEGTARLRGTVACDQLTVSGNGVVQITENDVAPPLVNRPPVVDAGPDQTITLPTNTVTLEGVVTDDGLPSCPCAVTGWCCWPSPNLTISWTVQSGPGSVSFSSPNSAVTTATFTQPGVYVLRLSASDSALTSSDETTVTVLSNNKPPVVNAGPDQEVTLPNSAALAGTVVDDGLPLGKTLSVLWSVASGPGTVTFQNAQAAATTASFSAAGVYVLRLTANDGEFAASDTLTVTVHPSNRPPEVSAGPDQIITPPMNTIRLNGSAEDDGMPAGVPLSVTWTQISGPVDALINDRTSAVTTATFTAQGTYVLRLTASDSQFTVSDEVEITVGCADRSNKLDVVLVIDRSFSMEGKPLADEKIAAKSFIDNLDLTVDQVAVVSFAFTPILHQALTHNAAAAKAAVDSIVVDSGTDISVGINTAQAELTSLRRNPDAIPVMLVLSDGESNAGNSKLASDLAKAAGTRIIAIALHTIITQEMRLIASSLNDLYITPSSDDLAWLYGVIAGSVCRNRPPLVRAGADFEVTLPNDATLAGEIHDDGLPANSRLTSTWSVVSGPGTVNIFDPEAPVTRAAFSQTGVYELKLTGSDSIATSTDTVLVTVKPEPSLENALLSLAVGGATRNVVGTTVSLTATLTNSSGAPMAAFPVQFLISGANATTATVITNASGVATLAFRGTNAGNDSIEARADSRTFSVRSGVVTLEWITETPPGTPPAVPSTTQGWIGGPLHLSTVTGAVPITLAAGITLAEGVVEYWPVSDPTQVTVLATNIQAAGGSVVATLDTTLIANGSYIVRLRGKNVAAGSSTGVSTQTAQPLDVATTQQLVSDVLLVVVGENKPGRVGISAVDFSVPLSGVPITIGRKYDSLERLRSGDFGNGWSLAFSNARLEVNPANGVTLTDPATGRRVSFAFVARRFEILFLGWLLYPSFVPEPGEFGTLTSDGCSALMFVNAELYCAFGIDRFRPTTYQYTDKKGRSYVITADGILRSAKDLNGNTFTFTTNGITSSAGLSIPFVRDIKGRITQINDALGRQYRYGYDTAGDLVTVTLPGVATPIRYTYDPSHRYLSSTDPRGNVAEVTTYHPDGRLASVTDAAGNRTSYAYNLVDNTTTTTNPDGGVRVERFNAFGRPIRITDELGNVTEYTYDANLNLTQEKNALGQITRHTYDLVGNRTSTTDPGGRVSTTTYNEVGNPVSMRNELGHVRTVLYDANFNVIGLADNLGTVRGYTVDRRGNPITITDASGATTIRTFDAFGRLLAESDPLGNTTTYAYDAMGQVSSTTDRRGNVTRFTYDVLGHMLTRVNPLNQTTRFVYDPNGNKTSEIDPLSRTTTFTYDAANRLIKTTFANNTSTSCTYDFRGNKLTETDQSGRVTTHTYDLAGRRVKTRYADGSEKTFAYDAIGRKIRETDERGNSTTYEYDPACACSERVTKTTDALGRATTHGFDAAGRLVSIQEPSGRLTRVTLDARNRITAITNADGTTITRTYDGESRPLTETNQAAQTTQYAYDLLGNLVSVTDPLGAVTTYKYDTARNLTTITDANLHVRTLEYDALNRPVRRTVSGRTETYTYDAAGNHITTRDFNGRLTTYNYDTLNRVTARRPDAILAEPVVSFTYTPTGKRATMVDASGTTGYTYDSRDRLLTKQTPQGTLTYTYDLAGNVSTLRSSNTDGASVNYAYDAINRLTSVTQNGVVAGTTTYTFDPDGNIATESLPNGVQTAVTYNLVGRVTGLTIKRGATTLASYSYGVGPRGERTSVIESGGRQVGYTYDAAGHLLREMVTGSSAGNGAVDYTWDPVGNRLTRQSTLPGVTSATYTYDPDDRLAGDTYDANGNTIGSGGRTFAYNFEDRLKSIGTTVTFVYDGDGNRVGKTAGSVTTRYLIDELSPTGYDQVVEEIFGGTVQRVWTFGRGPISQRSRVSNSWVPRYFGQDAHGGVRLLTDAAGAVTDTFHYDAFGNLLSSTGTSARSLLYAGEYFDADLGAYYLRERYYDASRGRFFTPDPFPGFRFDPQTQHRYLYVGGDPVNHTDPSGLTETFEYRWLQAQIYIYTALRYAYFALPCLEFAAAVVPDIVENIQNALDAGHPDLLTYRPDLRDQNRRDSLSGVPGIGSRDEYPFAATEQGGRGAWVGHVPARQNSSQGGTFSAFIKRHNLKPGDMFRVCLKK